MTTATVGATPATPATPTVERRRGGLRRNLRRLADPRVIGLPLFWFSYAWFLLEGLATYLATDPRTPLAAVAVAVAATAGQLATFAVLLLAKYTYLRPRMARRHPSWTVLSFAIAAFTGGIAARAVRESIQPQLVGEAGPDLFNHTVYMTMALCLAGVVIVALREHQADVASLASAQESLIATRVAGERALVAEREQVEQRVQNLAGELASSLPRVAPAEASAALGYAAGDVIRPLSHELALTPPDSSRQTVAEVPYPSWLATLRSIAAGPPLIRPALMAAMLMVLSASTTVAAPSSSTVPPSSQGVQVSVDLEGLFVALAQLGLVFAVVWLFARAAEWLLRRASLDDAARAGRAWEATILATVGIAVASQAVLGVIFRAAGFGMPVGSFSGVVQYTAALLAVVAVVAVINTTAMRRQVAVAELARTNEDLDWELRRTNELLWRQRRELSTWLHGPVQAALNAGAIQLAQEFAGPGEIRAAVRLFTEAVAKQPLGGVTKDIAAELSAVRDTWAPLCEVTWHLDERTAARIAADPACSSTLCDVIVEGCSNSVIHGGATSIDIELELAGERSIRMVLANNGSPVAGGSGVAGGAGGAGGAGASDAGGEGAAAAGDSAAGGVSGGLGTQMLNDVCLEWERVSTAEGTALKARFPLGDGKPTGFLAFGSPLASEGHSAPVAAAGTPAAGNVAERRG